MTTLVRRHRRPRRAAALLGVLGALLVPALVTAHPLGNFTINHYTGIRVEPDRVLLDVVIDQAEIPTFQARLDFDSDEDGEVSDTEAETGRVTACQALEPSLALAIDGRPLGLTLTDAGLTFPPGVGGLSTMRIVCGFAVPLGGSLAAGARVTYEDTSFQGRLGWREIVVEGSGVTLAGDDGELRSSSPSARLTAYPTNLLTEALTDTRVSFTASGGPTLTPFVIADATALRGAGDVAAASTPPNANAIAAAPAPVAATPPAKPTTAASVPGGVGGGGLPSTFGAADLSPIALLVSLLTAAVLGAGHALTPGHGKTLMAAYLVGTRGAPVHAVGLGLSVTLSHTLGILVLAALVVGAEGVLSPDLVVKSAPLVAAISIVAIGGWMLFGEGRRRRAHPAETHDHPPAPETTISWRSLFVVGLIGGLVPSTSALVILLGSIAAGRATYGFILVVAFGIGMALIMGGIGLGLVLARGRLDRVDASSTLGRASGYVPLVASFLVLGLGLYLTVQAVAGKTVF